MLQFLPFCRSAILPFCHDATISRCTVPPHLIHFPAHDSLFTINRHTTNQPTNQTNGRRRALQTNTEEGRRKEALTQRTLQANPLTRLSVSQSLTTLTHSLTHSLTLPLTPALYKQRNLQTFTATHTRNRILASHDAQSRATTQSCAKYSIFSVRRGTAPPPRPTKAMLTLSHRISTSADFVQAFLILLKHQLRTARTILPSTMHQSTIPPSLGRYVSIITTFAISKDALCVNTMKHCLWIHSFAFLSRASVLLTPVPPSHPHTVRSALCTQKHAKRSGVFKKKGTQLNICACTSLLRTRTCLAVVAAIRCSREMKVLAMTDYECTEGNE